MQLQEEMRKTNNVNEGIILVVLEISWSDNICVEITNTAI